MRRLLLKIQSMEVKTYLLTFRFIYFDAFSTLFYCIMQMTNYVTDGEYGLIIVVVLIQSGHAFNVINHLTLL